MAETREDEATSTQRTAAVGRQRKQIPALYFTIALLVVVGFAFYLGNRNFLSLYNINTITSFAAVLLMVSLGQMCTILIGGIDLSVGGLISFVSVVFVVTIGRFGQWTYPLCILLGGFFGYLNGNLLTRIKIPSFIGTLGMGGILVSLAYLVSARPVNVPSATYKNLNLVNGELFGVGNVLWIGLIVLALFYVLLRFTASGRNVFYVGSNIKMSWMSGINIAKTRNFAFILSGVGASIAGVMVSSVRFGGDPSVGEPYILNSIAAVVVGGTALTGGTGGVLNTLFGALLLSALANGMNVVGIDIYFQQTILGLMIIISVVLTFDRSKTPIIK